jgi:hypothetical protein
MTSIDLSQINGVRRIENVPLPDLMAVAGELTKPAYPHEQIYGKYCTLEEYIDCPPEDVFRYLADVPSLREWTYSLRDFEPTETPDLFVSYDQVGGGDTKIFTRGEVNEAAMTVDYHCAWDQPNKLWMIYLMRVVPAELVLGRSGSVVTWTNCKHPYYDQNPFPEKAPEGRAIWVGDLWSHFYAGHYVEMQNLKAILEHRHSNGLPIVSENGR